MYILIENEKITIYFIFTLNLLLHTYKYILEYKIINY